MSLFAAALARAALELFWPGRCPLCLDWLRQGDAEVLHGSGFACPPLVHRACLDGLPRQGSRTELRFPAQGEPVPVHFLWKDSAAFFRLLHALKYEGRVPLAEPLAAAMGHWVRRRLIPETIAFVVPVPDDPARFRRRGFSLNAILAAGVARSCGLPYRMGALRRRRPAQALATLQGSQTRRRVLEGVFGVGRLAEVPRACPILLVDDQVTSGATVEACLPLLAPRGHPVLVLALAGAARAPREVQP